MQCGYVGVGVGVLLTLRVTSNFDFDVRVCISENTGKNLLTQPGLAESSISNSNWSSAVLFTRTSSSPPSAGWEGGRISSRSTSSHAEASSRALFRPKNIELALGSSVYAKTARHGCAESSRASVQQLCTRPTSARQMILSS